MPMSYKKLFHLLIDMNLREGDLRRGAGFSAPMLAKLRNGQPISTDILCRICDFLQVQPGDIMEYTEVTLSAQPDLRSSVPISAEAVPAPPVPVNNMNKPIATTVPSSKKKTNKPKRKQQTPKETPDIKALTTTQAPDSITLSTPEELDEFEKIMQEAVTPEHLFDGL